MSGEFDNLPSSLRRVFPYLVGEACALRQAWEVYCHLFMTSKEFTALCSCRLGGLLGMLQSSLTNEILLTISRLTDRSTARQSNLSLWLLCSIDTEEEDISFRTQVKGILEEIDVSSKAIRSHRHKRIAHHDLQVSLEITTLHDVTLREIRAVIILIERLMNMFYEHYLNATFLFDMLSGPDITGEAEVTVLKAVAYDKAEAQGQVEKLSWTKARTAARTHG